VTSARVPNADSLSNQERLILDGLPAALRSGPADGAILDLAKDRLRKLAKAIEALAEKDSVLVQKTQEIAALRRQAAMELHAICWTFASDINLHLSQPTVQFDPSAYAAESFADNGVNLLQINVRGRILQIEFESTPEMISTENFRVPHILEGSIRCFNQEFLEQAVIEEQYIFYCLEKKRKLWRFFDARTYRSGPFDREYLIALMEHVV
jgi:type II secretory pathway component PulM